MIEEAAKNGRSAGTIASKDHITHLEIAVWEFYVQEQTAPLKEIIRKKKKRRIGILSGGELDQRSEFICRILHEEITAMENAVLAIEALKIAYAEHSLQLEENYQYKIDFLEMQWRGCWQKLCMFKKIILSQQKTQVA